jgi:hypothetical protein
MTLSTTSVIVNTDPSGLAAEVTKDSVKVVATVDVPETGEDTHLDSQGITGGPEMPAGNGYAIPPPPRSADA